MVPFIHFNHFFNKFTLECYSSIPYLLFYRVTKRKKIKSFFSPLTCNVINKTDMTNETNLNVFLFTLVQWSASQHEYREKCPDWHEDVVLNNQKFAPKVSFTPFLLYRRRTLTDEARRSWCLKFCFLLYVQIIKGCNWLTLITCLLRCRHHVRGNWCNRFTDSCNFYWKPKYFFNNFLKMNEGAERSTLLTVLQIALANVL